MNNIFNKLRERIAEICEAESPFANGAIELDENYFGAHRVSEVRGRGAKGKIHVFGILKRGDKVAKNCSVCELMPIIKGKLIPERYYIKMVLRLMTMVIKNIFGSSMVRMSLPMGIIISTVLRTSGDFAKCALKSLPKGT